MFVDGRERVCKVVPGDLGSCFGEVLDGGFGIDGVPGDVNRPGFPGDSISWEIMESWEDRLCIRRRCGSVLFGWCWSIGGSTVGSGRLVGR